ncbi:MAG TPA: hypothetical protein VJ885_13840 [Thermoanaerobaculia bacterium]|nr:hypothetical protein [Thermoanaerobaculia bacterium]
MEPSTAPPIPASPLPAAPAVAPTSPNTAAFPWRRMLHVAWMAIALGLLLELLLVLLALGSGEGGRPQPFLADLGQKISWGFIVCLGIAFGTTASKAREAKMGLLGLISAPLGFTIARALHKALKEALGVAGPAVAGVSPFLIGGLKGLQYALFGLVLGWIGKKAWGGLAAHVGTGAAFGILFGTAIMAATEAAAKAPTPPVDLMARGINELLFPIGCAVILYASSILGKRVG